MPSLCYQRLLSFLLVVLTCEAGKLSPLQWLGHPQHDRRQISTTTESSQTTTITTNLGRPSGRSNTCVCRLIAPFNTVTTSNATSTSITSSASASTFVESYVTLVSIGTASNTITTTLATASGTQIGTVEIIVPATTTTATLNYTGSGVQTVTVTTVIAQQSGTTPGTVDVILPNYPSTTLAYAASFVVPSFIPENASGLLVAAPVGVSIEFFAFPQYMTGVQSTIQCLANLQNLTGTWPPLRIGGTTQDRATYNASEADAVKYTVASSGDAPSSLTFGPAFASLAAQYGGQVILGLNRRLDNQSNTIAAAQNALSSMSNLNAIELGNEPNFYSSSDPIANGSWSASKDFSSQVEWQSAVSTAINRSNIFSAGVYFGDGSFNVQGLSAQEGTSLATVKDFCSHNYPQSASTANLAQLMSHSAIKQQIAGYKAEQEAASAQGKPYIMGETNSATQGGGGISPTFGAGLWILDYVMQSVILGIESLYFHQGTVGNCQYCWWGRYSMGAPYYGAYFATMALANASRIAPLDDGSSDYAGYAIFTGGNVSRLLLYNSDYYDGSGTRTSQLFRVTGIGTSQVVTKRMTALSAVSRQDRGQKPTIGNQTFQDGTCVVQGAAEVETTTVSAGAATFTLKASEALLVYL